VVVPEADPALILEGVTAGYGARAVVQDVSLGVGSGELVGLIGPNGSGKTTLVRVASRGLRPWAGMIRVLGRDPYSIPPRRAARLVAVVPQDAAPAFAYTVLEFVLMGRSPYLSPWGGGRALDWARAREAMAETNVQHLAERTLDELSGGERQRVVLAQALAQDAPVLLLDEPTTHLDLRHVLEVLTLVRRLTRTQGTAVLAVFHDLNLAGAFCDRIMALEGGRVVAGGSPSEVLTSRLLRDVFEVEADVLSSPTTGLPVIAPGRQSPRAPEPGRRAHVISGAGTGAPVMRALAELGFEVTAGVLHASDTDAEVAMRLNLLRISVPAFSAIDPRSSEDCLILIRRASVLVVCDPPFGPGNLENLRLALRGADDGIPVVLLDRGPIEERDFTHGEATRLWQELRERSASVMSEDEAVVASAGAAASRAVEALPGQSTRP
jgi:iron complex transport system ATP-binding protein